MKVVAADHAKGWSMCNQELEEGICSLAVPLCDRDEQIVAAMNITANLSRTTPSEMVSKFLPCLKRVRGKNQFDVTPENERLDALPAAKCRLIVPAAILRFTATLHRESFYISPLFPFFILTSEIRGIHFCADVRKTNICAWTAHRIRWRIS